MAPKHPDPPLCACCGDRPKWRFAALARRVREGQEDELVAELHCAVCYCGTWVWRGEWKPPGAR